MTFDQCATAYIAAHKDGWRNPEHAAQWESTLRLRASPVIGTLPVADVTLPHIMKILEPIWRDKTVTATRIRGRVESIIATSSQSSAGVCVGKKVPAHTPSPF